MKTGVRVARVAWAAGQAMLSDLRRQVFVLELGVPEDLEWDGLDPDCMHLLASDSLVRPLGCARITPNGQIGRMAVLPGHRGRGIGTALLHAALVAAGAAGMERIFLHAQIHAAPFYQRRGFVPVGGVFTEAGIPHVEMVLDGRAGS